MSRSDVCGAADQDNSTIWPQTASFARSGESSVGTVEAPSEKSSFSARSSNSLGLRHHRHLSDSRNTLPISPDSAGTVPGLFLAGPPGPPGRPGPELDFPPGTPFTQVWPELAFSDRLDSVPYRDTVIKTKFRHFRHAQPTFTYSRPYIWRSRGLILGDYHLAHLTTRKTYI